MPFPLTLMPGQQLILPFEYRPTMPIESRGNFVMTTDDPVFPERHLLLEGSAEEYADIFVQPNMLDFGALKPGCSSGDRQVRIFNAGTMAGFVDSVAFTTTTTEFHFTMPLATPDEISGGGSSAFTVDYRPQDVGADVSSIEIAVRDHVFPIIVPMQGSGTMNPHVTDTFQQGQREKVDVLFIMGNTLVNLDLQPGLLPNLQHFIEQSNVRQTDFHLGVASTFVLPTAGLLVGPVLTRSTPNLETAFESEANIGALGDDDEQSLEAMAGAFRLAANGVSPNVQLFRSDARLVVVIITDDDDTSPLPVVSYYNILRNHPSRGYLVAVVSGQTTGCGDFDTGTPEGGALPAPRLESFVSLTRGISASECSDWATTLSMIGEASFGLNKRFFLTKPADNTKPIVVTINGMMISPSEWRYDPASGSVEFLTAPPEGASITVDYTPAC
jgi:hypothetical protein